MKMHRFPTLLLTILIFVFSLHGCKKDSQPPKTKTVAKVETQVQPPAMETLKLEEQGYIYEPKGRPDPFMPLIAPTKEKEKERRAMGTLEGYDITEFKLVATAQKEDKYYGLLVAPDNKSYTVIEGTILGLHKGKVEKITGDKVVIIEYIKDYKGELKPRETILKLRKEE